MPYAVLALTFKLFEDYLRLKRSSFRRFLPVRSAQPDGLILPLIRVYLPSAVSQTRLWLTTDLKGF